MKYKHIVFDVDGTLVDTEYAVLHSLQRIVEHFTKIKPELHELTFALGIPGKYALEKYNITDSDAMKIWIKYLHEYDDKINVFGGMKEVLKNLKTQGLKLGVVTSKDRKEFEIQFTKFGIRDFFDVTVCVDDTTEHKPFPAPLYKYMELSGAEKDEVLYIGDSEYDMRCAHGAGIDFALAGWGCKGRKIEAEYYPQIPSDILSII